MRTTTMTTSPLPLFPSVIPRKRANVICIEETRGGGRIEEGAKERGGQCKGIHSEKEDALSWHGKLSFVGGPAVNISLTMYLGEKND